MWISYAGVNLRVVDLQRFDRVNVYTEDGTDLLYVRQTIGVLAEYAPGGDPKMTSTTRLSPEVRRLLAGDDDTAAVICADPRGKDPSNFALGLNPRPRLEDDTTAPIDPRFWHAGPETDAELRNRLLNPKQKLVVVAWDRRTGGPIKWLESPRVGMMTDATHGPTPLQCSVMSASGEPHSIAVYFEVQTDLPPCPIGSDRLVLSHRWQMTHQHDDNQYLTRVIHGQVIFNGAYLHTFCAEPDKYRNQFLHPIPLGFQRGPPVVEMSPDGLTMRYTLTDTDPTVVFSPGDSGCTGIEIVERMTLIRPIKL